MDLLGRCWDENFPSLVLWLSLGQLQKKVMAALPSLGRSHGRVSRCQRASAHFTQVFPIPSVSTCIEMPNARQILTVTEAAFMLLFSNT